MFEDRTYENIMQECLDRAPEGVDLRQGGIFFDAVASAAMKIAQFYADLQTVFELVFITTAQDEYLDRRGSEYNVFRLPATMARYEFSWTGESAPEVGERFFNEGLYFQLRQNESDLALYLEAEAPGTESNNILPGTAAISANNIAGLTSSTFGALIEPGANAESDENFRDRIMEKIAGPAENGNRQHYKTWAESIPGVGRARIIPLFAGPNTVMGIIIGVDGLPAASATVDRVQEHIDPMALGLTVDVNGETVPIGDGLGDGVANIGAHFAAIAPTALPIDVSFAAELAAGATVEQIKADASAALIEYFKDLVLNTPELQPIVVRMSSISSMLYTLGGLIDYTGLTVNGATSNITLTDRQVAVLGEVTVSEII